MAAVTLTGRILGAGAVIADLAEIPGRVDSGMVGAVRDTVTQGEAIVKGYASGRPGPNVITGGFRGGINSQVSGGGGLVQGSIGSNAVQAARLEYGFFGPDSLGRVYNQGPYPSFEPAIPEITNIAVGNAVRVVDKAIS